MLKKISRRISRIYIIQAIYSWQLSKNNIYDIEKQFIYKLNILNLDTRYFREIYLGVIKNVKFLDKNIKSHILVNIKSIGYVEIAVLRTALFELLKRRDIPYKVSINEAIEIVKIYGSEQSHKLINVILDKVSKKYVLSKKINF
ncbi:MAG: transcription antitermination factor NusB [Candidatus Makana argininalis]